MKIWAEKRVLITGGAGFIGSAIVWALNQRGCKSIVIVDRLGQSEKWKNLVPLKFEDYAEAESMMPKLLSGKFGQFDCILHMGGCSSTAQMDMSYLIQNNYEFTKQLAMWALNTGTRFVYASSAATYGNSNSLNLPIESLRPLNPYSYSKHLFDLYALNQGLFDRIVGLKFFNVFGPNENHKGDMRSVVHKNFESALNEGTIKLFKSYREDYAHGEQKRDFIYVKDAVDMALYAADMQFGGLFDVGSGHAHSWNDLAKAVFSALGKEPSIAYIEMPVGMRAAYQYITRAYTFPLRGNGYDLDKLMPLKDAVTDYVTNYLLPGKRLGE